MLDYPKSFTPNYDGYNDTWYIKDSNFRNTIEKIEIFDRYGKLLKQLNSNQSWDGTYLGNNLPADDYWFSIKFYNNKTIKNHFSLKR
ncbi:T9SS type B sorting domain-containing protein [Flavobacterium covae]|nr:T9SS type B sorting domain-containing protein [Flavobacterium covae]QYS90787.1 T9SS type B sorting domain-containing protein [Flavobacterium covae]